VFAVHGHVRPGGTGHHELTDVAPADAQCLVEKRVVLLHPGISGCRGRRREVRFCVHPVFERCLDQTHLAERSLRRRNRVRALKHLQRLFGFRLAPELEPARDSARQPSDLPPAPDRT
jgi:hypothetical protein